ncbi:MAG: SDR family oxidoreductase [Clostridia bacterium]|nr:SDR family oxidoreductase [Clostridia bacterium]
MKILITGASSGIGRDMARVLAKKGHHLMLVARNENELKKLAKELQEKHRIEVEVIATDLSKIENCQEIHRQVKDVDILINNAGFGDCGNFSKTSLEKEIDMIHTNIIAYHTLMKLYLIDMKEKGEGKILNVASIAGFMPGPLMATYYATKAYIVRLSEGVREELREERSKVQISVLCPGPVKTNFSKVANVKFHLKEEDSMKVAQYAIKKLEKGTFYIVPNWKVKLARLGAKLMPTPLISKVTYIVQKRKLKQ